MLFGYPLEACKKNWLHKCLMIILRRVHLEAQNNTTPAWPEVIPETFRNILKSRTSLRDKIFSYSTALQGLSALEQKRVYQTLVTQNHIHALLNNTEKCARFDDLPKSIRTEIESLYKVAFNLLTDLGIRDTQYEIIFNKLSSKVCPACGLEYFSAPSSRREDLDHILPISVYPFSGANLNNLMPLGNKCNKIKLNKDPARDTALIQRKSYNPYQMPQEIKVILLNSTPFGNNEKPDTPRWNVEFLPACEEVKTWATIFDIPGRYMRDELEVNYEQWLRVFKAWVKSARVQIRTKRELLDALSRYTDYLKNYGWGDCGFLKVAVFEMLHKHCDEGNERLVRLLLGIASSDSSFITAVTSADCVSQNVSG